MEEPMSKSQFRGQLEAAVSARHSRLNPFTEKWVKGELSRDQLGAWVCQHYQYVSQFARWCAAVYAECPDADARDFLLENIVEEGAGVKHVDLLIRFGEACGVSRQQVETARQLPTTRALTAWCHETSRKPFHVAAAGLLVGLESQVPGIYQRNLPPLRTHYGFTDHEVEFFAIHIEADEVHGERGYQIVERHCTTPERQAEAIEQVRQATEMRWHYMTGVYRAYVSKEEV
jgi:pyrroloquinoline-quinone synthase